MTLPFIKMYVRDWLGDTQLRMCSLAARGFWWECLCLMHCAARRGYLETASGTPISDTALSRLTGCYDGEYEIVRAELLKNGVPGVEEATGIWYNRRMVKDAIKAERCAEAGKRGGGNPALKADDTPATPPSKTKKDKIPDTRNHISLNTPFKGHLYRSMIPESLKELPDFPDAWMAWLEFRKAKKAPVTKRVVKTITKRLSERPSEAVAALDTCMAAGWTDVRWDWIDNRNRTDTGASGASRYQKPDPEDVTPDVARTRATRRTIYDAIMATVGESGAVRAAQQDAARRGVSAVDIKAGVAWAINSVEYRDAMAAKGKEGVR